MNENKIRQEPKDVTALTGQVKSMTPRTDRADYRAAEHGGGGIRRIRNDRSGKQEELTA